MKEAIGGSWLFTIVIVFVAIFATYVSISTNYTRSYKVKDEILSSIEKNRGITSEALEEINGYLLETGYRSTGTCPSGSCWYGFSVKNNDRIVDYGKDINFCVKKNTVAVKSIGHPNTAYYSIVVFFKLDMPVLREAFQINVEGETSQLVFNVEDLIYKQNASC